MQREVERLGPRLSVGYRVWRRGFTSRARRFRTLTRRDYLAWSGPRGERYDRGTSSGFSMSYDMATHEHPASRESRSAAATRDRLPRSRRRCRRTNRSGPFRAFGSPGEFPEPDAASPPVMFGGAVPRRCGYRGVRRRGVAPRWDIDTLGDEPRFPGPHVGERDLRPGINRCPVEGVPPSSGPVLRRTAWTHS